MNLFFVLLMLFVATMRGTGEVAPVDTPVQPPSSISRDAYAHPEWLVSGDQLRAMLAADSNVRVIALTDAESFAAGHIPGAAQVDWPALEIVETGDQQVTTWQSEIEATLTSLGITPESDVVIYDGGTVYAARLWWILDQLGHDTKRMLNGGLEAWTAAGGDLETGNPTVAAAPAAYEGTANEDAFATIAEVQRATDDANTVLIDARRLDEYQAGHIPGAINIPFTANASADGPKTWLSSTELRTLYESAGVTPDRRIIPYCTTGVRSAATYFTLRLLGYENVSLFTGSFKEWSSDPDRPIETGIDQ